MGAGFSSWFNMVVESCGSSRYFYFFSELGSGSQDETEVGGEGDRDFRKRKGMK